MDNTINKDTHYRTQINSFQLSNVNSRIYHLASLLGLFPAQCVAVYAGSTLRSMQDVLENRNISPVTYLFITAQVR